jgi:hypothetical protein
MTEYAATGVRRIPRDMPSAHGKTEAYQAGLRGKFLTGNFWKRNCLWL